MNGPTDSVHSSILSQWSDADAAFLVGLPEWEGRIFNPVTHGRSDAEGCHNAWNALEDLATLANDQGLPLPPRGVDHAATADRGLSASEKVGQDWSRHRPSLTRPHGRGRRVTAHPRWSPHRRTDGPAPRTAG